MTDTSKQELPASDQELRFPLRQFLIVSIPAVIAILLTALAITDMRFQARLDTIVAAERAHLHQLGGYVAADVSTSLIHLRAVSQEKAVRDALGSGSPRSLEDLQSIFATMVRRNPTYREIRWIDESGAERVRVVHEGERVFAVDTRDLLDTSNQAYFDAARQLLPGEVYISHLDLNGEGGPVEGAVRPTLRAAIPAQDSEDRNHGILIIDITMQHMVDALRSAGEVSPHTDYALVNRDGDWLSVPEQPEQAVFQLETDGRVARDHPDAWKRISARDKGAAELDDGFWIWQRLAPEDLVRRVILAESGSGAELPVINHSDFSLMLVAHTPAQALVEYRSETRLSTMLYAALLIMVFAWGLVFLLRSQVTEKRAALKVAYEKARADHMARLRELEERFRLLVEASDVGMIEVDENGTILMSNPAAEAMLGYPENGLQGMSVDSLLPPVQRSQHARLREGFLRNPEVRKMGAGRKLEALTADGRRIPVEVSLNPYLDHGKQVVLASIIELSR